MFHHRSATPAGVAGNGEVRSLGNNVTSIYGSVVKARADTTTASTKAVGGQQSGVRSTQGLRITIAKLGYMGSFVSRSNPDFCRTVLRLSDSVVTNTAYCYLRNII